MATILKLKVAKRRLFEKLSLDPCDKKSWNLPVREKCNMAFFNNVCYTFNSDNTPIKWPSHQSLLEIGHLMHAQEQVYF